MLTTGSWMRSATRSSTAPLPFADKIEVMVQYGVGGVIEPGGSIRSADVGVACRAHGITPVQTGHRLFHH